MNCDAETDSHFDDNRSSYLRHKSLLHFEGCGDIDPSYPPPPQPRPLSIKSNCINAFYGSPIYFRANSIVPTIFRFHVPTNVERRLDGT